MALVSTSQVVTDQSATPAVKTNALEKGGVVRTAAGYLPAASFVGGTTTQWYTFVRIPVRARILGIFRTGGGATRQGWKCSSRKSRNARTLGARFCRCG